MTHEKDIVWEGSRYWVLRSRAPRRGPVTQIMKIGTVASESVETYAAGADGESIAIARAKYLEARDAAKRDEDAFWWRMEQPEKFAYRIVAYLSRYGSQQCWPVELVELAKSARFAKP